MRFSIFSLLLFSCGMICRGFCQAPPPLPPDVDPDRPLAVEELKKKFDELQDTYLRELNELRASQAAGVGGLFVPSEAFMPPPADPGNLFFNETSLADTNLGAGSRVPGTALIFRAALTGNVLMWYDTGRVASGAQFNPATIAVGGSRAQGAGFFDLVDFNGQLKFDLNVPVSREEQAQAYLETDFVDGDLRVRHAFGRASFARINVLAGSYWTTWGDEGTIPKSINSINGFPAGANTATGVPQLRFAIPSDCGLVTTFAIQRPLAGGIVLRGAPNEDVVLQRYPDLAARLRYFDGDFFSLSCGALVHIMGRENAADNEDFAAGWGLSAATRFRTGQCGALMLGIVGGEGVGRSIFGLADSFAAAASSSRDLIPLNAYGTYVGYQHQWTAYMLTTLAYGIAQGDDAIANFGKTRTAQDAWANVIYKANDNFAFGFQYEYGDRELANGDSGDNHRLSLVVSVTTGQKDKSRGDVADRMLSPLADQSVRDEVRRSAADTGVSRFSRL